MLVLKEQTTTSNSTLSLHDALPIFRIVVAHPSTAKYLATKLCTRFISDEPPVAFTAATGGSSEMKRVQSLVARYFAVEGCATTIRKIGRASCRERVEFEVVVCSFRTSIVVSERLYC